jgi:hypothetical protein
LRHLSRSLQAEADVLRAANQPDRAADLAMAIMRLADMESRGGTNLESLISYALRRVGYGQVLKMIDELPEARLRKLLTALQRSVAEREAISTIMARQVHFDEQAYGWHGRLDAALTEEVYPDRTTPAAESEVMHSKFDLTVNIVFQADLAIRLFKLEHGHLPANLGELVPLYLPSPPIDPDGQPLKYRIDDGRYVLYSIGWDGKDDGGKFGTFNDYWASRFNAVQPSEPGAGSFQRTFDFDLKTLTRERTE